MPVMKSKVPRKINIKPLEPSQQLNQGTNDSVAIGIGDSPSQKTKPGSIHDILEQMTVSPKSPDSKAGKVAAQRWRSNAKKIYEEFCTETSFTAITRIYKATHICKKVAWLVICLGFIAWMTIQVVWLFQKYFSYPVEVKVELNSVSKLDFPSITVCNINPLRHSMMGRGHFDHIHDALELDDDDLLYDDYLSDLREEWENENSTNDIDDMNFMTGFMQERNYNKWEALENDTEIAERFYSELDDGHVASFSYSNTAVTLDDEDLKVYGHQKDNLIMSCTWQGAGCSPSNFTYLRNNKYGNCYTLNAFDNGQPNLYTYYAGPLMALSLELNIEQDEYVPALTQDAGVRILIHHRGVYPFPEDEGINIPPGFKTSIGLRKTEIIRLPPPHADCGSSGNGVVNDYTEAFGTDYSKQTCLKSCYQDAILEKCGCASSFYYVPKGVDVCEWNANFSSCIETYVSSQFQACNKKCPSPCHEMKYDVKTSMSKWPSEKYEDHLDKKIQKSNSHFMDSDERADSEETLAKVEIYFEDLVYEKVEQQKGYESQNLISDIGGQLGLWLGLSAITIGEMIEFFAAICQLAMAKFSKDDGNKGARKKADNSQIAPVSA